MQHIRIAFRIFFLMVLLTGLFYPLLVTGIAELILPAKAKGSLVYQDNKVVGSALIGQNFKDAKYFWPRPSAINYDPLKPSGGSNLGPTSLKLKQNVLDNLKRWNALAKDIPSELVYASGSGLDPHITYAGASFQIERIANARSINPKQLQDIIDTASAENRHGLINVLLINSVLDEKFPGKKS